MKSGDMRPRPRVLLAALTSAAVMLHAFGAGVALGASESEISRNVTASLTTLYRTTPDARALADRAVGVLVFPSIVRGGFIIAGQFGDGALIYPNR